MSGWLLPDFEVVRARACDWLPASEKCYSLADWLYNSSTAHVGEKALLMLVILFVLLSLLARFNGIKKQLIWPRDIPYWDDHNPGQGVLVIKQPRRPGVHRYVVLSYENIPENYWDALNKRDAYIKFRWLRNGSLEKEIAFEDDFTIFVNNRMSTESGPDGTGGARTRVDRQHIGLDENSYNSIRQYFSQIAQREDTNAQRIDNANFIVEMRTRKLRGIYFLLFKQPDPTFRITGWVVVLTGVFSIFQSIVFG
jgi:hypothetical protein